MTTRSGYPTASSDTGAQTAGQVVVNDVFVSPRVIDRRAFSELAGELRELVAQAAGERLALLGNMDQAARASEDFRAREAAQAVNLDLCAKAIKRIDERAAKVEATLAKAADATSIITAIEDKSATLLEAKLAAMEARAQAIQAAATAHTQALEERLKRATRELEQRIEAIRRDAEGMVGPPSQKLEAVCARAETLLGREVGSGVEPREDSLGGMVAKAETLNDRAQAAMDKLEAARNRAKIDETELEAWLARGSERLDQIQARWRQVDTLSAQLAGRSQTSVEELRTKLEETAGVIQQTLSAAVEAAHGAGNDAVNRIRAAGEQALGETQQLLSELAERMVHSRLEMQSVAQQIDEKTVAMRTEATTSIAEIKPLTENALGELTEAIRQSHQAHNTTGLALKLLEKASTNAGAIVTQLKPWEGVVLGSGDAQLPEPIRKLIESVRSEMQGDLSSIAVALRAAADRAERVGNAVAQQADSTPVVVIARKRCDLAQSAD